MADMQESPAPYWRAPYWPRKSEGQYGAGEEMDESSAPQPDVLVVR
ncbi:hypothetical protein AAEP93_011426 [Penicillium crustosum]